MNTRYKQIFLYFLAITFFSCSKEEVESPEFNATAASVKVKAGEAVQFAISGNPDYISFYSGEAGGQYENRDRTMAKGDMQTLQFSSLATGTQPGNVKLMVSRNFDGIYTPERIAAATWTDITGRAVLSTGSAVASGAINLTDFNTDDKPVYIAFYYNSPVNALKPRSWTIAALTVNNIFVDPVTNEVVQTALIAGNFGVAGNFSNAGFTGVSIKNDTYNWVTATNSLTIAGGPVGGAANEDWVISSPLALNSVPPDYGKSIKAPDSPLLTSYSHTYTRAGTYTVTFLAKNSALNNSKEIVKQIIITVEP